MQAQRAERLLTMKHMAGCWWRIACRSVEEAKAAARTTTQEAGLLLLARDVQGSTQESESAEKEGFIQMICRMPNFCLELNTVTCLQCLDLT